MIKQRIARFIFRAHGWKLTGGPLPEEVNRCVFLVAPHTSNWDFYYGVMCMIGWGVPIKIAIKKFWTRFPLSLLIGPLGGIGIDRAPKADGTKRNQVAVLAQVFKEYEQVALVITPEGSRSKRTQWKTGFYYVAKAAGVPIVPLTADYPKRTIEFGPVLSAEQSLEEVMQQLMEFYSRGIGKYPEFFSLDERYS